MSSVAFTLSAYLGLDTSGFKSGLESVKNDAKGEGDGEGSLGETLGNLGSGIAKKMVAAFAAIGVGKLIMDDIKKSLSARGDFEQWTGAAGAIFGDAADEVTEAAQKAATVAGLSANDYLEYVNEIGRILTNQGMEQASAAENAMALVESAADYAATYNVSMEEAYAFVKAAANGTTGVLKRSGYDFSDDAVQAYAKQLGIVIDDTNRAVVATQMWLDLNKEIDGAFEGSLDTINNGQQALAAAWDNFLTTGDISGLLDVLIDNVIPMLLERVPEIIEDLAEAVVTALPRLVEQLPTIISTLIPALFNAAGTLITGLIDSAPQIVSSLANAVWELLKALVEGAIKVFTDILNPIIEFFSNWFGGGGKDEEFDKREATEEEIRAVYAQIVENLGVDDLEDGAVINQSEVIKACEQIGVSAAESLDGIVAALHDLDITVVYAGGLTSDGSHAAGLMDVPFNGYVAQLHKGEMILNKAQADAYREGYDGSRNMVLSIDGKAFAAAMSNRMGKSIGNRQLSQLLAMGG